MITLKKYLERNPTETEEERHLAEFAGNIEKDNLELRRLGGKVAHYVKAARSGDSPLIQAALVESIDEAIKAWDDYLSNVDADASPQLTPQDNAKR